MIKNIYINCQDFFYIEFFLKRACEYPKIFKIHIEL